ncbi:MAG: anaerobic ribonucleoside-triphosphate reductase activating protein [Candidatus Bathyarchaeota archaeon]|nr:anaerobic ribonucleoside-triphosphate reductase activating protein [Candidatus Bathyarchaeota archaeon]
MRFCGFKGSTLVDYPDRVSSILFVPECNLRCPFCQNWRIVIEPEGPFLSEDEALDILGKRCRFINSVVITGGEPTYQEGLPKFLKRLKEKCFSVKLDTNGMRPDVLGECLALVDYVAMDIKTAPGRYGEMGGSSEALIESVGLLLAKGEDYEFRCTVVPGLVDEGAVLEMGRAVSGARRFAFQQFVSGDTLDPGFREVKPFGRGVIKGFGELMESYVDEVILRI